MKYKILALISIIIFIGAIFWIVPILKERYFSSKPIKISINNNENNENSDEASPEENIEKEDKNANEDNLIPEESLTIFIDVEKENCLNGCSDFKKEEEKKYCLQVCSSSPSSQDSVPCLEKSGLQKDYCYKSLGIENKNLDECKKITDKNIRESCITIVTNKILERSDVEEQRNP